FAVSEQYLEEAQLRAFRLLGLVPGGSFDAHVAAALLDVPVAQARRLLELLLDAHLLQQRTIGRYRFHDLLRQHARDAVEASECAEIVRAAEIRMLDYYLGAVRIADVHYGRGTPASASASAASQELAAGAVAAVAALASRLETEERARAWLETE